MTFLNKTTIKELFPSQKKEKVFPVTMMARKSGSFGLSYALYIILGSPEFVEMFLNDQNKMFILASDEENGFKITANEKAKNYGFSCKPIIKKYFPVTPEKFIVYTESVLSPDDRPMYEIRCDIKP